VASAKSLWDRYVVPGDLQAVSRYVWLTACSQTLWAYRCWPESTSITKRTRYLRNLDRPNPSYNQEDARNHQPAMEIVVPSLQRLDQATYGLLHPWTSETGVVYPIYWRITNNTPKVDVLLKYMNEQMHKDHNISRCARRKDTLSAEDLGILLQ